MARDESNREDLLREATALVERIELVPGTWSFPSVEIAQSESIVAGFRVDGALSVFFGDDPVYQFNAAGELRRAYSGRLLIKASHGRLISLSRVRDDHQVQLVRHELTDPQQIAFLAKMTEFMRALAELLSASGFEVKGQVPADADVLGRVRSWLEAHVDWPIAARPNA